jgi:hypothetical protein
MGQWVFSELRGDDVRRGANDEVLFKTEQTAEGEYAGTDALVREVLQNSVDARSGSGPVRVRMALHEADDAPSGSRLAHYFGRLQSPLAGRQFGFDNQGIPQIPCRFLVVEDFGTRGLEGNTTLFRDPPPGDQTRQYFYWFWRNIGRSGKTGDDLGRWGLGKTVYRAASRVGCMFGLSVRESDRRKLLMGQVVLQIHEHQGKEYKPEGYWCGLQNSEGLPLSIENAAELAQFSREWRITRTDEPGLSVISPFVPAELKADRLLQAVAVHFFTRILRGELEVEVAGPGIGTVKLDRAGLGAACRKTTWDGPPRTKRHIPPPIDFARQCVAKTPEIVTDLLGKDRVPDWNDSVLPETTLHDLRRKFSAGELVGVRVRLGMPMRTGVPKEGQLDAWLQRTTDGQRCDSYYVREGMTITKINSQASKRGVKALVVVDSGPLAELLGDTEGPAHEDWDTSAERPDRVWKTWKGRVKFVRRVVDGLVEVLTPPATEPDFDLLSDFFSIERVTGQQLQRPPGAESKRPSGMVLPEFEPKWFQIASRPGGGGFTVSRQQSVPKPPDVALRVAVAYDLPKGDPLRNWNPIDFVISNATGALHPKGRGVKAQSMQGNIIVLKDIEEDFHFAVEGFDRHRDLFVRVDEVPNNQEAAS